jgi:hypothetical protein
MHNHEAKLLAMMERGEILLGGVYSAEIRHDDWCALLVQDGCEVGSYTRFIYRRSRRSGQDAPDEGASCPDRRADQDDQDRRLVSCSSCS